MFSRTIRRLCWCALFLALFSPVNDCPAAIITEGDTEIIEGEIFVARQEDGSLTITAPTVLRGGGIHIASAGRGIDATGRMVVDGGAYHGDGEIFEIGGRGHGILEIINGGRVNNSSKAALVVSNSEKAQGDVLVSGPGSFLSMPFGDARIGVRGIGAFTIESGAVANHDNVQIGSTAREYNTFNWGETTLQGAGSRWDVGRDFNIGNGSLTIQEGALLRTGVSTGRRATARIGNHGAAGFVVVEGPGSLWQHSGQMELTNGTQIIRDGAIVNTQSLTVSSGSGQDSQRSSLIIDGPGSRLSTLNLILQSQESISEVLLSRGAVLQTDGFTNIENGRLVLDGPGPHRSGSCIAQFETLRANHTG